MQEYEIDLRPLVRALVRGWRIFLACMLAGAAITSSLTLLQGPTYTAQTQIAIVQLRTEANFQSSIRQQDETLDPATLRTGLVTLGSSNGNIAQDVIDALGNRLDADLRSAEELQRQVAVVANGNTNVLQITVEMDDSDLAREIATLWGESFVRRANLAFGTSNRVTALETELTQARTTYEERQREFATSDAQRETVRLARETSDLNALINTFRVARLQTITDTLTAQSQAQATLLRAYSTAFLEGQTVPLTAEQLSLGDELRRLYANTVRVRQHRTDTAAFRDQLRDGNGAGGAFAYALLKAQIFAGSNGLPTDVQAQVTATELPTVADVEALLAAVDGQLRTMDERIVTLAGELRGGTAYTLPAPTDGNPASAAFQSQFQAFVNENPNSQLLQAFLVTSTGALVTDQTITTLERSYQDLAADLEQAEGRLFVLRQERDLAQANYTALSARVTELRATTGDDTVVRLVGPGVVVDRSRGLATALVLGVGSGFLLALLWILSRLFLPDLLKDTAVPQRDGERG